MATGSATVNFGAFPGTDIATVVVTGQAAIVVGSDVEAWIDPQETTEHSEDEHRLLAYFLGVSVARSSIVGGTGFTITAVALDERLFYGNVAVRWAWK